MVKPHNLREVEQEAGIEWNDPQIAGSLRPAGAGRVADGRRCSERTSTGVCLQLLILFAGKHR